MDEHQEAVVQEIFKRSIAGVFAHVSDDGACSHRITSGVPWTFLVGLAGKLQHDAFWNVRSENDKMPGAMRREIDSYPVLAADTDLSSVPIDALIVELYRVPGKWVLALRRHGRGDGPPWDGCVWNGTGIVCMGLAALSHRSLCDLVGEEWDREQGHDPIQPLKQRVSEVLPMVTQLDPLSPLVAAGVFGFLAYESNRLRDHRYGQRGSIKGFIEPSVDGPWDGKRL